MRKLIWLILVCVMANISIAKECPSQTIGANYWLLKSEEYKTLTTQIYRNAAGLLKKVPAPDPAVSEPKPKAIILDIDETVLRNDGFRGKMANSDTGYSDEEWNKWILQGSPTLVPGALDFITTAVSQGYQVFFVSNRTCTSPTKCPERDASIASMVKNGLDLGHLRIEKSHFMLKNGSVEDSTSSKKSRYERIQKDFEIVMILGDDIKDLIPDNMNQELLKGTNSVLLPNPTYGSWTRNVDCETWSDSIYSGTPDQRSTDTQPSVRLLKGSKASLAFKDGFLYSVEIDDTDKLCRNSEMGQTHRSGEWQKLSNIKLNCTYKRSSSSTTKPSIPASSSSSSSAPSSSSFEETLGDYVSFEGFVGGISSELGILTSVVQLSKAFPFQTVKTDYQRDITSTSVWIFSDVSNLLGNSNAGLIQIDARIDVNSLSLTSYGNIVFFQKLAPYLFFSKIESLKSKDEPSSVENRYDAYLRAPIRSGIDFNIFSYLGSNWKLRVNAMTGYIWTPLSYDSTRTTDLVMFHWKPYVRIAIKESPLLDFDFRFGINFYKENFTDHLGRSWETSFHICTKEDANSTSYFGRVGANWRRFGNDAQVYPLIQIGYSTKFNLSSVKEKLPKDNALGKSQ